MTGWATGRREIADLLDRGHLDKITGEAANGDYLLAQARQRLDSAHTVLSIDPVGAFELAYDCVRTTAAALLTQQGLRGKSAGGHAAICLAVRAQFGERFDFFNVMRRVRNKLEYPRDPDDLLISEAEVQQAIAYAEETLDAAGQLLPLLKIW